MISNAVKFTYTGYIKVKVEQVPYKIVSFENLNLTQVEESKNKFRDKLFPTYDDTLEYIKITIEDSGIGIKKED